MMVDVLVDVMVASLVDEMVVMMAWMDENLVAWLAVA